MDREKIFVGLVGVSGVGKSTIAAALAQEHHFTLLPSFTTRHPREGDAPGELRYVTDQQYDELDATGCFLEKAGHGDARYALSKPEGPGPYVSPINGDGIAYLIENADRHGLYIMPVGLIPPDRDTWNGRNRHLGLKAWWKRRERDEHFGIRVPPPLKLGTYELTLKNRSVPWTCEAVSKAVHALEVLL